MGVNGTNREPASLGFQASLKEQFSNSWAGRMGRILGPFSVLLGLWCVAGATNPLPTAGLIIAYIAGNLCINMLDSRSRFPIRTAFNTILFLVLALQEGESDRVWILALPLMFGSSFAYRRDHAFWMRFLPYTALLAASIHLNALDTSQLISLSLLLWTVAYASERLHIALRESTVSEQLKAVELHRVNTQLTEALATRQVFIATISHEVRTPLHGLLGMAEILAKTSLTDEQRRLLRIVRRSGEGLSALISGVLDIAKIDSGELVLREDCFDPHELAIDIVALVGGAYSNEKVAFHVRVSSTVPSMVLGDYQRIRQVLLNLVGNAAKFTEAGSVTTTLDWKQDRLSFHVRDTGPGIEESVLPHLFKPFQHFDTVGATAPQEGSGLGLSICKRLVENMGGVLEVESRLGDGAVFRFWVEAPAAPSSMKRREAQQIDDNEVSDSVDPTDDAEGRPGPRVLLVDDSPINRTVGRLMLSHLRCSVTCVASGEKALTALNEAVFDLVLMDCRMPVMDGYETTSRIVQRDNPPPIVALTASVTPQERARCVESGMVDFIEKPANVNRLAEVLQRWVFNPESSGGADGLPDSL